MSAVPPLFHWSPADRRDAILTYGLVPAAFGDHAITTCTERVDYVCLSPDPRRAWTLSGATDWTPAGAWDLWQVHLKHEHAVHLRLEDGEASEWMVRQPIAPRQLWLIATRTETAALTAEAAS